MRPHLRLVFVLAALLCAATLAAAQDVAVRTAKALPADKSNKHYPTNRAPLRASPFVRLPIGHVEPRGWLRENLRLEADGMTGHLPDISRWCKRDGNAWASGDGTGHSPWEEAPYWLKGYGDLGFVLKDPRIMAET